MRTKPSYMNALQNLQPQHYIYLPLHKTPYSTERYSLFVGRRRHIQTRRRVRRRLLVHLHHGERCLWRRHRTNRVAVHFLAAETVVPTVGAAAEFGRRWRRLSGDGGFVGVLNGGGNGGAALAAQSVRERVRGVNNVRFFALWMYLSGWFAPLFVWCRVFVKDTPTNRTPRTQLNMCVWCHWGFWSNALVDVYIDSLIRWICCSGSDGAGCSIMKTDACRVRRALLMRVCFLCPTDRAAGTGANYWYGLQTGNDSDE